MVIHGNSSFLAFAQASWLLGWGVGNGGDEDKQNFFETRDKKSALEFWGVGGNKQFWKPNALFRSIGEKRAVNPYYQNSKSYKASYLCHKWN